MPRRAPRSGPSTFGPHRDAAPRRCDALAGLRPWLLDLVETDKRFAGATVFQGRFSAVNQAIGVPKARDVDAALPFLEDFARGGVVLDLSSARAEAGRRWRTRRPRAWLLI